MLKTCDGGGAALNWVKMMIKGIIKPTLLVLTGPSWLVDLKKTSVRTWNPFFLYISLAMGSEIIAKGEACHVDSLKKTVLSKVLMALLL